MVANVSDLLRRRRRCVLDRRPGRCQAAAVSTQTIYRWKLEHQEFYDATQYAKAVINEVDAVLCKQRLKRLRVSNVLLELVQILFSLINRPGIGQADDRQSKPHNRPVGSPADRQRPRRLHLCREARGLDSRHQFVDNSDPSRRK